MRTLRLILGDQLNLSISSLHGCDKQQDIIFMCEVFQEATYVPHHKKKIALIFSAMRHFAQELKLQGFNVDYIPLAQRPHESSFHEEVSLAIIRHQIDRVIVTEPGEYRVLMDIQQWERDFHIPVEIRVDDRFLCSIEAFLRWAKGKQTLRMEYFYREMRKKYSILMSEGLPVGGVWNFDSENRKPPREGLNIPQPFQMPNDEMTQEVLELVEERFSEHFGDLLPFNFAVTRAQALEVFNQFLKERLSYFGTYQDAMLEGEPWMYHSHISFYLNCGLLLPLECIQAAEHAYLKHQAPLNAVEGFIRQIMGWREFVRGIYWLNMPKYAEKNFLNATRKLPDFFWTGKTQMNCLRQCITETKQHAYAHHIQRLMVIGNYLLLTGVAPKAVNEWFLIVYADAYEWVEMPNVTGMILFADGGVLASKPYAASGAYINKMSDYCKNCAYNVKEKLGSNACPYNYLYWNFLIQNREALCKNPRLAMMYKTIAKMSDSQIQAISNAANDYLQKL